MFIVFSEDWRKQAKMIKKYQLVQASFFGAFTRENVAYQGVAYQIKLWRCIRNVRFLNIVQSHNKWIGLWLSIGTLVVIRIVFDMKGVL